MPTARVGCSAFPCLGLMFTPVFQSYSYTDDYDAIVYGMMLHGILYNATVLDVVQKILANVSLGAVYSSVVIYSGLISSNRIMVRASRYSSVVGISAAS